ncbi:MAG: type II toxin-antitoxin system VapC family toxin [Catonella sp.]|jgi:PIN domain nuclease of toxin-antitoxin system|nr:type II toxin-antitoxin system VapC family toxin [Catonella sp.]
MKYLLDTHILLWALRGRDNNNECLPNKASEIILDPQNEIYYSSINIFEVEIKRITHPQLNLPSGEELIKFCVEAGFTPLDLKDIHTLYMKSLKKDVSVEDHKDPYDWLLVSQAKCENMRFVTHDSKLKYYLEECILSV